MSDLSQPALTPGAFVERLQSMGLTRAWFVYDAETGAVRASDERLEPLRALMANDSRDYTDHEGVFLGVGPTTGALFGAFVHKTCRGQGQGGLRYWRYPNVEAFLRDGLRLAKGMTRKSALAGLWWGGGKGIIAHSPDTASEDAEYRARLYQEYGDFVTSLRGAYICAEDAGTRASDMMSVFEHTRYTTCVSADVGGSGNPSPMTARGVVVAMAAARDFRWGDTLSGKRIVMQGIGNVGTSMIRELLQRDVGHILATDIDAARCAQVKAEFTSDRVEIRCVDRGDNSVLFEPCDVLAPNALGGVLGPDSIPQLQTPMVCGAANNQLLNSDRDGRALADRDILYVPDFVANRMGIVNCANEQYGWMPDDPSIMRHFNRRWEESVFVVTQTVLGLAKDSGETTTSAAIRLADERARIEHPVWGHRGQAIINGLIKDEWHIG
jgi:glutamate dehydrogenase/leucine dehydrogenase